MPIFPLLAVLFFLVFAAPQAQAYPTFVYKFSITSFSCANHPFMDCPQGAASASVSDWAGPLGKIEVGLNASAMSSQHASLLIHGLGDFGSMENQGFDSFNPQRWNVGHGPLDLSEKALTGPFDDSYWLQANFNVFQYLTGMLYINNSRDELFMETSGSTLWSGFIRSDELGLTTSVLDFTGEWQFKGVVPEPGMLWLFMGAAFAATAVAVRRQRMPPTRGLWVLIR